MTCGRRRGWTRARGDADEPKEKQAARQMKAAAGGKHRRDDPLPAQLRCDSADRGERVGCRLLQQDALGWYAAGGQQSRHHRCFGRAEPAYAAGRHEQRVGEAGAEHGRGLHALEQRGAGPAASAYRRAEDDDHGVRAVQRATGLPASADLVRASNAAMVLSI